MSQPEPIEAYVLGGSGYVAGEMLRLLSTHEGLELCAVSSSSRAGQPLAEVFPFLWLRSPGAVFVPFKELLERLAEGRGRAAVFSCLPHGTSAAALAELLGIAADAGREVSVVDLSADFRLEDAKAWEELYEQSHGAPHLLAGFTCALPDLTAAVETPHVAHPGCFTTAVTLAIAPLLGLGLCEPEFTVDAITGSTGSGREPKEGTHHPERHASMVAYKPLRHRHRPEMEWLCDGVSELADPTRIHFVPHSGPFARGIHATVHAHLNEEISGDELALRLRVFYEGTPFVQVSDRPPALKSVVGTNLCRLGVAAEGRRAVITSVIDNLTKGAAGGALQWMNRLCGFGELEGLSAPAPGWL